MPESKGRAKPAYTPVGLLWVVTFYVTSASYPIPNFGYKNLIIGFGLMISGFMMTMRWR